jgi:alanyl aminopeptidase
MVVVRLSAAVLLSCIALAGRAEVPTGNLPADVEPLHYRLHFMANPTQDGFTGETEIDVRLAGEAQRIYLHGKGLEVSRVVATRRDGTEWPATYSEVEPTGVAALDFERPLPAGESTLEFQYRSKYRTGAGLHKVVADGQSYLFTQFQAIDARTAFPSFDEPRFKTPFDVSVTAPEADTVVSNGAALHTEPAGEGMTTTRFATSARLPTYLVFLAVGPLEVVNAPPMPPNAVRKHAVPLRGIVRKGKGPQLATVLEATDPMIAALEAYFGVPYPYPKLDLIGSPDFSGAMENAAAILYDEPILLVDASTPASQLRGIAVTHAHELAHQWFGDLVTPKWWDGLWLNEAFATWMGTRIAAEWRGGLGLDLAIVDSAVNAMTVDSRISARAVAEPVNHNRDIESSFDFITYQKGGAVISMFERYLGEEAFREGVRLHIRRYADGNADTAQFMQSLADGSRRPEVVPAFRSFVDQSGLPVVEAKINCSASSPRVFLRQSRYFPLGSKGKQDRTWLIPACLEFGTPAGATTRCINVDAPSKELSLEGQACPSYVLPNAGGKGYYRFALDDASWQQLFMALPGLDPGSKLMTVNNFTAAFLAGQLPAEALLSGLETAARLDVREAVLNPQNLLRSMDVQLLSDDHRPAFHRWLTSLYRPQFERFGYEPTTEFDRRSPNEAALWRGGIAEILVELGHDREVSEELARRAERFLAGKSPGELDRSALDPSLVRTALVAGVRMRGRPFFDELLEDLLASNDSAFQQRAAYALGSSDDPAIAARARELLLDASVSPGFADAIAGAQSFVRGQAEPLVEWMEANQAAYAERVGMWGALGIPYKSVMLCSSEGAARARAVFEPEAQKMRYERRLAQTLETIELCAARKAARGPELDALFSAQARRATASASSATSASSL